MLVLVLAVPAWAADQEKGSTLIRQDVTIRSKAGAAPALKAPLPGPAPAVLREMVESLEIYKRDHPGDIPIVRLPLTRERLSLPYPEPPFLYFSVTKDRDFDWWRFEILDDASPSKMLEGTVPSNKLERDASVVWHLSGEGPLAGRLVWDGTGYSGAMDVRLGRSYRWRFTAAFGKERFAVKSEPVPLWSMYYREALGTGHLVAANKLLFQGSTAKLADTAGVYLDRMVDKLRRVEVGAEPYRISLYQRDPDSGLAKKRAAALRRYLSEALLISPSRVEVERRTDQERGDVTDCTLH